MHIAVHIVSQGCGKTSWMLASLWKLQYRRSMLSSHLPEPFQVCMWALLGRDLLVFSLLGFSKPVPAARNDMLGYLFWPDSRKTVQFTKAIETELCHCLVCYLCHPQTPGVSSGCLPSKARAQGHWSPLLRAMNCSIISGSRCWKSTFRFINCWVVICS